MLMIHAGPLYSALQMTQTQAHPHDGHHQHASHEPTASGHGHHGQPSASEPAWLSALELCGYCELLTLNPPLTVSLHLVLPTQQPVQAQPLPEPPLRAGLQHRSNYPRGPPLPLHS